MKKVLIVDDDEWFSESISQRMRGKFAFRHASNVHDAMELLDDDTPDCIVLDVFLPSINGIAFLHELKSYSDTATIPVIVWSNHLNAAAKAGLSEYGVRYVLDKTALKYDTMLRTIERTLFDS